MLFFLLAAGQSALLGTLRQTLSLRYAQAIPPQKAAAARRYAAAQPEGYPFWPTFWAQEPLEAAGGTGKGRATCLWFSGEGAAVWPAEFLTGGYPAPADGNGVAVSSGLAWQLWGSVDVVGLELAVDGGAARRVRGVFREEEAMLLAGVGETDFPKGWHAVELRADKAENPRAEAEAFATQSGLGAPDTLVNGPAIAALGGAAAFLPAALLLLCGLFRLGGFPFRRFPKLRRGALVLLLFAAAALLPLLLNSLPPEFVPGRLSDFGFWARTADQLSQRLRQHLLLRPMEIDLAAKLSAIRLAAYSAASMAFGICLAAALLGPPRPAVAAPPAKPGAEKIVWRAHSGASLHASNHREPFPPPL